MAISALGFPCADFQFLEELCRVVVAELCKRVRILLLHLAAPSLFSDAKIRRQAFDAMQQL